MAVLIIQVPRCPKKICAVLMLLNAFCFSNYNFNIFLYKGDRVSKIIPYISLGEPYTQSIFYTVKKGSIFS